MDIEKIKEIIYSKCKVYRKEKRNPYPNEHLGLFWQYEMYAYTNVENKLHDDSIKGSEEEVADLILNRLFRRMSLKYKGSKEEYDLLPPR